MICCPGGDLCALANARSIPIATAVQDRFDDLDYLYDIGDISLKRANFHAFNGCGHGQHLDKFTPGKGHGGGGHVLAVNGAALDVPACRVGRRTHGNGQVRRNAEQANFVKQAVGISRLPDNLVKGLRGDNRRRIGQGVESVGAFFRLGCAVRAGFAVGQFLAQQGLKERCAVLRGCVGVRVQGNFFKACGNGVEHGFFLLVILCVFCAVTRFDCGLCVRGVIYDTDFINLADSGYCAGLCCFVKGIVGNIERERHLRQVAALDGFIYRPRLFRVGQVCFHFKPTFGDGQVQGLGTSGKGQSRIVVVRDKHHVGQVNAAQRFGADNLGNAADLRGLAKHNRHALKRQGLVCRSDFILSLFHFLLPRFQFLGIRPRPRRSHSSGIADGVRRPRRAVAQAAFALRSGSLAPTGRLRAAA
ncbi:MAG: hypothetical protein BWY72_00316 [Bacteroidetes bacterium ADurb.Bin416]|nr:MAG: hypothetical protein BWY72_00316 [Bacteroidetes bacterium ADurb.Bin416]